MAFNVRQIFVALNDAQVEYVVVGGLAVILHGYLRATADLDIAIGLTPDNAARTMQALASIGLCPRLPVAMSDFANSEKRRDWREHCNMLVFPLWDPANPLRSVDVFIDEPIDFQELRAAVVHKDLDGVDVPVASLDHLIRDEAESGAVTRPRRRREAAPYPAIAGWRCVMSGGCDSSLHYDFAALERDQLAAWCRLSTRQKIDFFEEMVVLAYHSGALAPERLALRDRVEPGNGRSQPP